MSKVDLGSLWKKLFSIPTSPLSRFLRSKRQAAILAILEVVKKMKDWSSRGLDQWLMAGRLAIVLWIGISGT